MEIRKLDRMFDVLGTRAKKRLVAAWAIDAHTIMAVSEAVKMGIIEGILVGDEQKIKAVCREHGIDAGSLRIVHCDNDIAAA
ncbi:MAG: phosphate acyltransferase, partial [Candidatus Cloacimonetes bacterium]|nr:phosphate acyltransferase [Candidatus Cloacimonadota bacterium]